MSEIEEGQEIHISYGERANTCLLNAYGFALENNKYDYTRIWAETDDKEWVENLEKLKYKSKLRIDLKKGSLDIDLLVFLRCNLVNKGDERLVLASYKEVLKERLARYKTTLESDKEILA